MPMWPNSTVFHCEPAVLKWKCTTGSAVPVLPGGAVGVGDAEADLG